MLCEECRERPATVHLTRIVNNRKTEAHLCERCAREREDFGWMMEPKFSIHNLLAGLLDTNGSPPAVSPAGQEVRCDKCGLTYRDFARLGRLGCRDCYDRFRERLDPLLRRIHGGTRHAGKVPRRTGGAARARRELERLRQELQRAVTREEFEKAAELRDRIREMEKQLGG